MAAGKFVNLIDRKFGRLTTIEYIKGIKKEGIRGRWRCRCECGEELLVYSADLTRGFTRSCGCLSSDILVERNFKHGISDLPEYEIWCAIKRRCKVNPKYYKKKIKVCDRWLEPNGQGFINFLEDMGPRPGLEYSIERIDNDGDYCPKNCKWATRREQNRNKDNNLIFTIDGISRGFAEWCEIYNVSYDLAYSRLYRGWDIIRTLETPLLRKKL